MDASDSRLDAHRVPTHDHDFDAHTTIPLPISHLGRTGATHVQDPQRRCCVSRFIHNHAIELASIELESIARERVTAIVVG